MINVLFAGRPALFDVYEAPLNSAFAEAGLDVDLSRDHGPEVVDYVVLEPGGPVTDFAPFSRAKAVLSLWAGVETLVGNQTLTQPLTRMVDPGLTEGMVEWVTGYVLQYHLEIGGVLARQNGDWDRVIPPLARHRSVGVLGLGALGFAVAEALRALNFDVAGWSRRNKNADFTTFAGDDGLHDILACSEILVLLLPKTPATENTLNARTLSLLPKGARLINPGRGALIDDAALVAALDAGHIAHATLDVFRQEPLPKDHPYWAHPNVTVSPHVASETRPDTASMVIAKNVQRAQEGEPLLHLVDRTAGY
ncbi:MAG: glyoxylate/hydroxypyruvate reductase A [Pseudomonadota bacterium]